MRVALLVTVLLLGACAGGPVTNESIMSSLCEGSSNCTPACEGGVGDDCGSASDRTRRRGDP